jgi:uncharacterized membrane protein (UPF0127 family)
LDSFLSPLLRTTKRPWSLRDRDTGIVLATTIEPAFDSATRRRGLLGRSEFADGSALIIAPCSAIHTFFMQMKIDVVFASRSGRVLKTYSTLRAWRAAFAVGAFAVIELPADTVEQTRVVRSHTLEVVQL